MHAADVRAALDGVWTFFKDRETRPGVLARRLLGRAKKTDPELADHLVRERRRRTRMDGSMDGSLVRTAWTTWELLDLDCPPDHAGVVRTLGYVLAQQDRPGHFAEACAPERHEQRRCKHFVSGFFSPGTPDEDVAPLTFPSGVVVTDEQDARFAASCFALRVALRAGEDRRESVRRHLDSLVRLFDGEASWLPDAPTDLHFFTLGALALAPPAYRDRVDTLAARLLELRDDARTWTGASPFHSLDMLLSVPTPAARDALREAATLLCKRQQPSGAFDPADNEEQALIAARVLHLAAR